MCTIDDLFEAFGGPAEVGRAIGKSTEHASAMRRRGSIPVGYWSALVAEAEHRGLEWITYEALVRVHSRSRAPGHQPAPTAGRGAAEDAA